MKPYFFSMSICHHRTLERISTRVGVVFATDEQAAQDLAWSKFGSNTASIDWVEPIAEDGFSLNIHKKH